MKKKDRRRAKKKQRPQQKRPPLQVRLQPKGRRLWLFWFVVIFIIPALLLLGLETGLWVFDYGVPTGFTFKQKVDDQEKILSNPYFTWRFFEPQLAREGSHFSLPLKKVPGTYRIFVLGASAALGVPEPAYGMTRMLDTMLRDQYPGVDFDVIDAAITAINSHVVLPIARDCRRLDSDLFVVYLGNNEVVGPYGAGSIFSPQGSSLTLFRSAIALKATRLGQLVQNTVEKTRGRGEARPGRWRGMEMFLNNQVRATDPGMETVYGHFEKNLLDICRVAQRSGIPAIVSTVGVNLKDSAPFASLHHPGLSEQDVQEWEKTCQGGETLREQGKFEQAIERFLKAEKIDADYAELHFRLGSCYWAMGDFRKAKDRYVKARELDTLRFRADTRINEIIRRVAGGKSAQGIHLVDSLQIIEANSPHNTPGNELFYEHVHLNFRGTYLVAQAIFEQVQRVLPEWVSRHASGRAVLTEQECARRLAYTGWARLMIAENLLDQMQRPPFTNQLYGNEQVGKLLKEVRTLKAQYAREEDQREVLEQYKAALENYAAHWRLHDGYANFQHKCLKNAREAEKHLKVAIKQCPQSATELTSLGKVLTSQGKHAEAEKYYRKAMIYNPQSTLSLSNLGIVLLLQGKLHRAIRYLKEAIEIDPLNESAHSGLGIALRQLKPDDPESRRQAVLHFKKAIEINPGFIPARYNLGDVYYDQAMELVAHEENDSARELLQQAVELTPYNTSARYDLAALLNKEGDRKAAAEHLSVILRIDPEHRKARESLAWIYSRR